MAKVLQTSAFRQIERVFSQGTSTGLSDTQLLERFANERDETAFEMLVARHGPMVLGVCRGVLHDSHAAEDAFQATFLVLARKAPTLWVKSSLANWLYQVAVRVAVQSRSDSDSRRRHELGAAEFRKQEGETTDPLEPDLIPLLCEEISRLPEKYRAPVILCHLEELTHEAAAHLLGCPIGTVHGRLSRARELLRRRLVRRGVTMPLGVATMLVGSDSFAATIPEPLRHATLQAARNLLAGQGISAAVNSAMTASLLAATLRSMTKRAIETAIAMTFTVGLTLGACWFAVNGPVGLLATADEPSRPSAVGQASVQNDAEAIQGTWTVTAIEQVHYVPSEEEKAFWKSGRFTITIAADRLIFDVDKSAMKYRLNTSATPKRMLWTNTDDPSGKVVAIAFYLLEDDDLKICVGRSGNQLIPQPPHGFDIKDAPAGTFPTLFVMKRKKTVVPGNQGTSAQPKRPLPAMFDKPRFDRVLLGGKEEPLFVDFDSGHFLTPPFALEYTDRNGPLTLSNLAIPNQLKDWVRRHGIDAAVQTDGRTITLLGLEMKAGQPVSNPDIWPVLTFADALRLLEPSRDQPRVHNVEEWPRFEQTFQTDDPPIVLPFLTREGSLGHLNLRMDRADAKATEGIRLSYQIGRGLVPKGEDLAPGRAVRRSPGQAILDDRVGAIHLQTWKGGIVLTRPGCPEWIEIDQGKVIVKVNRAGSAGPDSATETLVVASRLVTDVIDLDGRRLRATIMGVSKALICRRVRDRLAVEVGDDSLISCDRITLDLPNLEHLSKDPRIDAIVAPKSLPARSQR